ncbi:DUF177 domain-containing protein [Erysipelothrix urinaevulpis]|uniref:YceD family protein n=1 Tax=Erysipelothrix urinaevulpis TaxID=2683717 RepID=UPI001357C4DB|nr:YceD family protein [Erysipelothrix urinaevulpis]
MKFLRTELDQSNASRIEIDEALMIELEEHPRCNDLKDIHASGDAYYDHDAGRLTVNMYIDGEMIVPCAITLKPLSHPFSVRVQEVFAFDELEEDEDSIYVEEEELDLDPYILAAILADIPLKLVDPELTEYPSGDGWVVMSEEDYLEEKSKEIDPRLAKLKEIEID